MRGVSATFIFRLPPLLAHDFSTLRDTPLSENGEFIDIHIRRPNPNAAFGFGVASMWRIDGRINVVSWIDPDGPAAGALQREDALVSIDGTDVDDLDLEEVKEELRNLCETSSLRVMRWPLGRPR